MRQPEPREWNALANLIGSGGEDYQTLMHYLEGALQDQDVRNRTLDGPELHRGQGRSLALAGLLQLMMDAPDVRKKLRERS